MTCDKKTGLKDKSSLVSANHFTLNALLQNHFETGCMWMGRPPHETNKNNIIIMNRSNYLNIYLNE